jgi:hypothetical protein
MADKTFRADDYLNGTAELPADFDTGYRHHLETARQIVRRRKGAVITTTLASRWPRETADKAAA